MELFTESLLSPPFSSLRLDERLELDYQIGEDLKDRIIPRAIDFFTGKALQYEDMDGLDDDDFEDDDEDDEVSLYLRSKSVECMRLFRLL